jgi:hypothetical protein
VASKIRGHKALTNTAAPKCRAPLKLFKVTIVVADLFDFQGRPTFYRKKRLSAL